MTEKRPFVLLVDDRAIDRHLVRCLLKVGIGEHLTFLEAGSNTEAIEIMQQQRPNLVIAELLGVGPENFDIIRAARAMPSVQPPVIVLTRRCEPEVIMDALEAGCCDLLPKGMIHDAEIVETTRKWLEVA